MEIALIAAETKKELMVQFCIAYCGVLAKHNICSTKMTGKIVSEATGLADRGVTARPTLYVLRKTTMPALLLEVGFITNANDAALMANNPGLIARGIYNGILRYFGLNYDERDDKAEQNIGKVMRAGGEPAYRHHKDKGGTGDI